MEDNTGGGTTPDPEQYIVLLGEGDDIPDDKEVVGELGLLYYLQLIVKPLLYLRGRIGIVFRQTLVTEVSQKLVGSFFFR